MKDAKLGSLAPSHQSGGTGTAALRVWTTQIWHLAEIRTAGEEASPCETGVLAKISCVVQKLNKTTHRGKTKDVHAAVRHAMIRADSCRLQARQTTGLNKGLAGLGSLGMDSSLQGGARGSQPIHSTRTNPAGMGVAKQANGTVTQSHLHCPTTNHGGMTNTKLTTQHGQSGTDRHW
jgi:hypothetical protein